MRSMLSTLDVSKLSGWLNADACCRESNGGHTVRSELRNGRRRATAVQAACRRGLDCRLGAGHGEERTQNMAYMVVTLDVSKLSGWLNTDAPCRESKGGRYGAGRGAAGRREETQRPACRGELDYRLGAGHGEEHTWNM